MARRARIESETGLYHVTMRGNSKQTIFENDIDRVRYLNTLSKYCEETETTLLVYCLMSNHVHLLVGATKKQLSLMIKKLCDSYTFFYNRKYDRTGALFQERFGSRPIENGADVACVLRYILNNPVKAGLCQSADRYRWNSYREYIREPDYCDVDCLFGIIGDRSDFLELMNANDDHDGRVAIRDDLRVNDTRARAIISELMKGESAKNLAMYPKESRDEILRVMKSEGMSIRQIARLTGLGRGVIQRA